MFGTRYYYAATRGIGARRLRAALLASSALALAWTLPPTPSCAQDATWLATPGSGEFYDASNWTPGSVPTGTATFGASNTTTLNLGSSGTFGGWTFDAGASNYTFNFASMTSQDFTGSGITINGGSAMIGNSGSLSFANASTAGGAGILNNNILQFIDTSTAGSATITNGYVLNFHDNSTAGSATINNSATMTFTTASRAGSATISNLGNLTFYNTSTADSAAITNNGFLDFRNSSTAGSATITNNNALNFFETSRAGNAAITNNSALQFYGSSTADGATITNNGGLAFLDTSTAGSANISNVGNLNFHNTSTAGGATITNNGILNFRDTSTAGNGIITNIGVTEFRDASTAGSAAITNSGTLRFLDVSSGGNAAIINQAGGTVDISGVDTSTTAGSIAGAGNYVLGSNRLIVGSNDLSTEVSGVISGAGGSLVKTGAGTLILTGANTYTGGTTITSASSSSRSTLQLGNASRAGSILGAVAVGNWSSLNIVNADMSGTTISNNSGYVNFYNASTAGNAAITNNISGSLTFQNTSTAGSATITNDGGLLFNNASTAGSATITNNGNLLVSGASTAGSATITNNNVLELYEHTTAGSATIANNSLLTFYENTTAGNANITNNGTLNFNGFSAAGSATIANNGALFFNDASTAGNAAIANNDTIQFIGSSTAGNATITNTGTLHFLASSWAGSAIIANSGTLQFFGGSRAGNAAITNNNTLTFYDGSTADSATIANNGSLVFNGSSRAGSATITNNGYVRFNHASTAGSAALINNAGGIVDFSNSAGPGGAGRLSAGSIAGAGNYLLGTNELTVGSSNLSTEVSGVISGSGSLVKTGTGRLTLSGINTYAGATNVDRGVLRVDGSIVGSSGVMVNANGALMGTGTVGGTAINSGGSLLGGNGTAGTSLTISGNLAFQSGAYYLVEVNPVTASSVNVTGAATLGGATVNAAFAGGYVAKRYTILTAGSLNGTFSPLVNTNLSSNFRTEISYDAAHAYLNLTLSFVALPGSGLSGNQQNVGNAIVNSFNRNGGIAPVYGSLTAAGLTQASGETATGAQQSTFNAMTMFMGAMTDPFIDGRNDIGASVQGVSSYAADGAARRAAVARDAFAAIPPAVPTSFEPRWNVWAAGFGGSQTTNGNTATGSNGTTSRLFGTAAGADYRFSAHTLAGFALAGGGTSFSVVGGDTGRSDLFQAGAFVRHHNGPAYLSAALAYGWQDVTTDRTVTVAGIDRLQARFQANSFAGRVEGGYRFTTPWMAVTPYAAGQVTTFQLPAYAESVLSGANTFALNYDAKTVTASRSELGLRTDRSWAVGDAILTLRGRAAWAHDFNPDRAAAATFQTLPGASFVVNGAAQARDAALAAAAAEMKWRNGFSLGATFEGEFSNVTRSYAGKGVVRYAW